MPRSRQRSFAIYGTEVYPDATFTLRLAFGQVKGYTEQGKQIPPWTTFTGLYERSKEQGNVPPFELPQRWVDARANSIWPPRSTSSPPPTSSAAIPAVPS